jgi:LCP family protein required for cell wall assembly
MVVRRDRRPAHSSSPAPQANGLEPRRRRLTPSWSGVGLAAMALLGAFTGATVLAMVWPKPDRSAHLREEITAKTLAPKPRETVTVLVIGSDADTATAPTNGAAPPGPANSDALLLVRVNAKGPVQVLQLPSELALSLPGREEPLALRELYRQGGAALTAETLHDLLNLNDKAPERYIVVPRQALRQLVDAVGGLEVSPPRRMKYQDKTLKYKIDLQSGLQRLSGDKVEQLVRFRDPWLGEQSRRANHQVMLRGLRDQLAQPDQLAQLQGLLGTWLPLVETNLTTQEMLSLLAASLDNPEPLRFQTLPLKPATKEFGDLRQLDPSAAKPLWPTP